MIKTAQHREWNSGIRRRVAGAALALAIMLVPGLVATKSAQAQLKAPWAGVVRDAEGNLYGTANGGKYQAGAVYKLDKKGHETVLYSFKGTGGDGASPNGGVILDSAGNLYGTTDQGGNGGCNGGNGCGTVYKVDKKGHETVLYTFKGTGGDGANPGLAGVVRDPAGNLYGTTTVGGASSACSGGCGTVYKLDQRGHETVLYSFQGGTDGDTPNASVFLDAAGNLYGTTVLGGTACACGTVYKVDKSGHEIILHSFSGASGDGAYPNTSVILDAASNLYGTTAYGGSGAGTPCNGLGCGTVFKVDKRGNETVLYSFQAGTDDGAIPLSTVVPDMKGNLYGVTYNGATSSICPFTALGCGTVYKLDKRGHETVLHKFRGGGGDGADPADVPALIWDAAGNLYGTTRYGGTAACGCGTVFKVDKRGHETILYSFTGI